MLQGTQPGAAQRKSRIAQVEVLSLGGLLGLFCIAWAFPLPWAPGFRVIRAGLGKIKLNLNKKIKNNNQSHEGQETSDGKGCVFTYRSFAGLSLR